MVDNYKSTRKKNIVLPVLFALMAGQREWCNINVYWKILVLRLLV